MGGGFVHLGEEGRFRETGEDVCADSGGEWLAAECGTVGTCRANQ